MRKNHVRPHPSPLPQEREKLCASLENSHVSVAVAAALPFVPGIAQPPASSASPINGERFSFSPGEQRQRLWSGERASVLQTNPNNFSNQTYE